MQEIFFCYYAAQTLGAQNRYRLVWAVTMILTELPINNEA